MALPLIFSQLSRVLMSLVDLAMVGGLGPEALAATATGGIIIWSITSVTLGIKTSVQTLSSRRFGQKKLKDSGRSFYNGVLMAVIYSIPICLVGYNFSNEIVLVYLDHPISSLMAIEYTKVLFVGLLFTSINFVFHGFLTGIEKTKIHLLIAISSNALNAYLNAGLIYGSNGVLAFFQTKHPDLTFIAKLWAPFNFEALGVKGAALGTVFSSLFSIFQYFIYTFFTKIRTLFKLFPFGLDITMLKKQVTLALPMGVQEFALAIGWAFYLRIFSIIGIIEFATIHVIFSIMHASFMPAMGIGMACSTLVSKYMGEKKTHKSVSSIKESVRLAEYGMGTLGVSFILFPELYLSLFTNDMSIIKMGVSGLRIVGALQFLDAIGFVLMFALIGAGNTVFPAVVESFLTWFVVVLGTYVFGVVLNFGFVVPWFLFPVHMSLFAGIMVWKIRQGDWKRIDL